ncbi:hypothetical protein EKL99_11130 [Flavobacterium sp. ZB4P23]|uniref:hypothetical protein n=1 Tax=Flavobacterium sp. ZB4P23 TaxID=2497484 RepID=UPI000F81CE7A|nr:hypothetical protein [Flavobacterium sp. ZB4P23]RTY81883.1 hypothetical protein EKL99_11130 [Flavobacterium sp. ZB4P23]
MELEQKTTKEIRTVLKSVINKELLNIETLFEGLPPKERLEIIVKLIPYVLPKVDNVNYSLGETTDWGI